jgi:hypothetical protein
VPSRQRDAIRKRRQEHEANAWINIGAALQGLRRFADAVAARVEALRHISRQFLQSRAQCEIAEQHCRPDPGERDRAVGPCAGWIPRGLWIGFPSGLVVSSVREWRGHRRLMPASLVS